LDDGLQNTDFGSVLTILKTLLKLSGFPDGFAEKIPVLTYNKINDDMWHKLHNGHEMLPGRANLPICISLN